MVEYLINTYQTEDPFKIADLLGIVVLQEELGSINGFYNCVYNQKFIHVNGRLTYRRQYYVFYHELGHALLHPDQHIHFMNGSADKLEVEADLFALGFLLHGKKKINIMKFSEYYGIPLQTIKLYLKSKWCD